jgi:hypothetical protein
MDKESEGFAYLKQKKIPKISEARIKEGVFVCSQSKELR